VCVCVYTAPDVTPIAASPQQVTSRRWLQWCTTPAPTPAGSSTSTPSEALDKTEIAVLLNDIAMMLNSVARLIATSLCFRKHQQYFSSLLLFTHSPRKLRTRWSTKLELYRYGLKNVSYSDRLCRLGLPTLELRRLHQYRLDILLQTCF